MERNTSSTAATRLRIRNIPPARCRQISGGGGLCARHACVCVHPHHPAQPETMRCIYSPPLSTGTIG
eukprot:3407657-Prymnesium_polylepis.1